MKDEVIKMSIIYRLRRWCKQVLDWEGPRTTEGARVARMIREEIERLSQFKLYATNEGVEGGYIRDFDPKNPDLDYKVSYNKKIIAELDTVNSYWTFAGSSIMPVNYYKGINVATLGVPIFIVNRMNKEPVSLKDQCVWIKGKDIVKCEHSARFMGGKYQHNYWTNKTDWHRGLESLVEELKTLSQTNH